MDADAEQVERLKEFGLPTYAIRAYLALLKLGTAEARHVSELARIAPAKVYGTLDQLQQRGLVNVVPGKPRKYSPVPMAEFLDRRLRDHRERMDALAARKDELVHLFPLLGTVEAGERASVSTIRGRRNIGERFRENAAAARRDLVLLLPAFPSERLRAAAKAVEDARARGVRIRIVAHADDEPDDLLAALQGFADEFHVSRDPGLEPHVGFATFDGESALLAHFGRGRTSRDHGKDIAILTKDTALATTLTSMIDVCWREAAPAAAPHVADLPDLLRGLGEAIVVTDAMDRVVLWSRGAQTAFGPAEADVLGRPIRSVLPRLDDEGARDSCDRVESRGGSSLRLFRLEPEAAGRASISRPARVRIDVAASASPGDNDKPSERHHPAPHAALGDGRDDTHPHERHRR